MNNFISPSEYTLLDETHVSENGLIFCGYRNKPLRQKDDVRKSGTHKQQNRIYSAEGTMFTLSSQEVRYFIYDGERVGRLTPRECLRLMGFDDRFMIVVSDSQAYRQAGNSIVVNVLEAVFVNIDWKEACFYE